MHNITETTRYADILKRGTILWRQCSFNAYSGISIEPIEFKQVDPGTKVGKVNFWPSGLWEPEVIPESFQYERFPGMTRTFVTKGVVLFVKGDVPGNWTHLLVEGVSKAMQIPGLQNPGSAIFARAAEPYGMKEYLRFRQKMLEITFGHLNSEFSRKVTLSNQCWPEGWRVGDRRLIRSDGQYAHLVISEATARLYNETIAS